MNHVTRESGSSDVSYCHAGLTEAPRPSPGIDVSGAGPLCRGSRRRHACTPLAVSGRHATQLCDPVGSRDVGWVEETKNRRATK
uniref:Uncharacterized protein n=1 Tax=Arundo donax TaxID=35708 RepID=A0A0A9BEH4_ARUDO